jgi:hypothetical protein
VAFDTNCGKMFRMILMLLLLICLSSSLVNLTSSIDKVAKNKKTNKTIKNPTKSIKDLIFNEFKDGYITPTFETLKEAKNYFNYFNKNKCGVLVAFDVSKHDKIVKNWFIVDTLKELYNFILQNPNCPLYEQINTDKHKLFFDVDVKKGDNKFNNFNFPEYKSKIENELNNILNNKNLNFVWLNSTCSYIHSYHLIVNNVFCNIKENLQIKDYLNKQLKSSFLDNVYKSQQCFRLWNCSKFGEKRPLKLMTPNCCFNDTLVNIYSSDKVEKISTKIPLCIDCNTQKQTNESYIIDSNVPFNNYLMKNFKQSKYKNNVYVRKCPNISLPCPICISPKDICKEKHHKNTDVYIFKKNGNTYMGCFRGKQWDGDRHFLNLTTNKVEYLVSSSSGRNVISPNIVSANENYKMKKNEFPNFRIAQILYDKITFGKYKGKQVKDLFEDLSYTNWILSNKGFDTWKIKEQIKVLIEYYKTNNIKPQPTVPIIDQPKPTKPKFLTKFEMVEQLSKKWGIDRKIIENDSLSEIKMHFDTMKRHGCFD